MKYTKEFLEPLIKESRSFRDLLVNKLGVKATGGNRSHIKSRIEKFNLCTKHFEGQAWKEGRSSNSKHTKETFIEQVLKLNGKGWKTHTIKLKLYEFGLRKPVCSCCGIKDWLGKPISMHLDHINGNRQDNRLNNLRILCPNCHSQTDTYAGNKNKK